MAYRIITVSREFESMGSEIAQEVAARLHIPYVDKFLITESAQKSGFPVEHIEARDEVLASRFEYSQAQAYYLYGGGHSPYTTNETVAKAQFDIIRDLVEEGPCLIVGRCANYILRDREDVLDVFIRAGRNFRIRQAMKTLELPEKQAAKVLKHTDKARQRYYKHYTGQDWYDPDGYHLSLNSDRLGVEACVELILKAYNG